MFTHSADCRRRFLAKTTKGKAIFWIDLLFVLGIALLIGAVVFPEKSYTPNTWLRIASRAMRARCDRLPAWTGPTKTPRTRARIQKAVFDSTTNSSPVGRTNHAENHQYQSETDIRGGRLDEPQKDGGNDGKPSESGNPRLTTTKLVAQRPENRSPERNGHPGEPKSRPPPCGARGLASGNLTDKLSIVS